MPPAPPQFLVLRKETGTLDLVDLVLVNLPQPVSRGTPDSVRPVACAVLGRASSVYLLMPAPFNPRA